MKTLSLQDHLPFTPKKLAPFFSWARLIRTHVLSHSRCIVCTAPLFNFPQSPYSCIRRPLCSACEPHFKARTNGYCPHCGELYATEDIPNSSCSKCLKTPPQWQQLTFLGSYEGTLRQTILDLKFNNRIELACFLSSLLLPQLIAKYGQYPPDAIIPIPLHSTRLTERGYNQSLELCRPLAKTLGIALLLNSLTRIKATPPQAGLNIKNRQKNVKNVFRAFSPAVSGKHILLVDDILTTGTTLEQATKQLLDSGAKRVDVAVIARTPATLI